MLGVKSCSKALRSLQPNGGAHGIIRASPPQQLPLPMHVFFEDDGAFKAGTVLADNDTSLQVETASGKRMKIKAANVLLRFADPSPAALLAEAQALAERHRSRSSCGKSAAGASSRSPIWPPSISGARRARAKPRRSRSACTRSPMYFYKKGKGRYKAAPADALKAALAGARAQAPRSRRSCRPGRGAVSRIACRRRCATACRCCSTGPTSRRSSHARRGGGVRGAHTNPLALLAACGAIPSTHDYHFNRFLSEAFPRGTDFPTYGTVPRRPELPLAPVRAFSIDDATTTEIDDAFSVRALAERQLRDRHPHRRARARDSARLGARCDRARAAVDRLHAGPQDHDAARRGDRALYARRRRAAPGVVAVRRDERPTARRSGRRRASSACRSPPICGSTRSASSSRARRRRASRVDR